MYAILSMNLYHMKLGFKEENRICIYMNYVP